MQQPSQGNGGCGDEEDCRPVAQLIWLNVCQDEMYVDKVYFQTNGADESKECVEPFGGMVENVTKYENARNGEGNV